MRKPLLKDNHKRSDGTGTIHQSGGIALIRASLVRALMAPAVIAGSLALAGCNGDGAYQLPTRAMKELSPEMLSLLSQKGMPKESPILIRIFKEESELEVWKQNTTGRFELLKVYPICRWSGELGPKVREGDRQAPEGFYTITPDLMNPNSNYYLAINTGFPNAYDRANNRSGAFLMIHGDCSSRGCYAMTDEEIGEIYSLARESFLGGQQSFQIQAYPFRMTAANLARHRNNPNMAFWKMIKEGNDHFEVTRREPKVEVCDRHYVFDAQPPANSSKPLVFNPTGRCPEFEVAREIAGPAQEKARNDEMQFAQLVRFNVPVAPVKTGTDGGMNRVFLAQLEKGRAPDGRIHAPGAVVAAETTGTVNSDAQPSLASRIFGGLFGSKPAPQTTQVAASAAERPNPGTPVATGGLRGSEPTAAAKSAHETAVASARPKAEPGKPAEAKPAEARSQVAEAAKPKPKPQQEANAAASGSVLTGAQPVVPSGSFDSRWAAMQ